MYFWNWQQTKHRAHFKEKFQEEHFLMTQKNKIPQSQKNVLGRTGMNTE